MRFRPRLRKLSWALSAVFLLNSVIQISQCFWADYRTGHLLLATGWLILAGLGNFYCMFVYWDFSPEGLTARVLWKVKRIPWQSVRSVGKLGYFRDNVKINYGHSIEDYGNLVTTPANREKFIAALRQFAPQAEFEN